jgi:transcriptional regulator of acetoin/glycerol metabolism
LEVTRDTHVLPGLENKKTDPVILPQKTKLNIESVKAALKKTGGNKSKAARVLCVGRATLYRFLANHRELDNFIASI